MQFDIAMQYLESSRTQTAPSCTRLVNENFQFQTIQSVISERYPRFARDMGISGGPQIARAMMWTTVAGTPALCRCA